MSTHHTVHTQSSLFERGREIKSQFSLEKIPLKLEVCIPTGPLIPLVGEKAGKEAVLGGFLSCFNGSPTATHSGYSGKKFRTVSLILLQFNFPSLSTQNVLEGQS